MFEGPGRARLYRRRCKNLTDGVSKTKRHRHTIREHTAIEVDFGKSHHVLHNCFEIAFTLDNFDMQWIWHLTAYVGSEMS